jgi:alanine racemase
MRSRHVVVSINLDRVRVSAERIRTTTGVPLIAVIKADAYGLGAARVADALAAVADDFAYFSIHEAREVGRPGLVLGPPEGDPAQYRELKLRPSITNRRAAEKFAGLPSAVNVDTGMQRFGCPVAEVDDLLRRSGADEAYTHTDDPLAVARLQQACGGRVRLLHAAASGLLDYPETWLDAVRPGVALYLGAMRVSTPLVAIRHTHGRVGYSGFECPLVGIILAGYSHYLRAGPVLINGQRQQVLEVGMNTSYVSVDPADHSGDEVVLLGDGLTEAELAEHFQTREHEILCRYSSMGMRQYEPAAMPAATRSPDTTISTAAALPQT